MTSKLAQSARDRRLSANPVIRNRARSFWRTNSAAARWFRSSRRYSARSALVSARSFTISLLGPAVQIVVMLDGLVAHRGRNLPHEPVGGIPSKGEGLCFGAARQIKVDGLAHERGERAALPRGGISKLPIGLRREAQIRRDVLRHAILR